MSLWFPGGGARTRKKTNRNTTEIFFFIKIGKFPTPNYTLNNVNRQMEAHCSLLVSKGLSPLIHKEPL